MARVPVLCDMVSVAFAVNAELTAQVAGEPSATVANPGACGVPVCAGAEPDATNASASRPELIRAFHFCMQVIASCSGGAG